MANNNQKICEELFEIYPQRGKSPEGMINRRERGARAISPHSWGWKHSFHIFHSPYYYYDSI
jgi:hypothetical protein